MDVSKVHLHQSLEQSVDRGLVGKVSGLKDEGKKMVMVSLVNLTENNPASSKPGSRPAM